MMYETSGMDLFRQAMGFTPAGLTDTYTKNSFIYARDKQLRDTRSKIMRMMNQGREDGDDAKQQKARDYAKRFNAKFPNLKIEQKNFGRSWRAYKRQRENAVAGVSATTKTKKQAIEDVRF